MRLRLKPLIILGSVAVIAAVLISVLVWTRIHYSASQDLFAELENFDEQVEPWVECSFNVPNRPERIVFLRQCAHPFLAEYNRKLRIERPGANPAIFSLLMDTGGVNVINVYLIRERQESGPWILLCDPLDSHLFNLSRAEPDNVSSMFDQREYLGRIEGRTHPLRFIPACAAPEESIHLVGGG